MKKYLMEFIGTFFLVSAAILGGGPAAAATLMIMVYAGGHISGGHYNPAVSLSVVIRGKQNATEMAIYWMSQFIAAIVAAYLVMYLKGSGGIATQISTTQALLSELLGTFALAFVVLNVATAKATEGNSYYGLAIGGTVLAMALTFGSFSGGAFNPAVALGVALFNNDLAHLWVYLGGCLGGGLLAGLVFNFLKSE